MKIRDIGEFTKAKNAGLAKLVPRRPRIAVGMGTCGVGNGADAVYHAFANAIDRGGLDVQLTPVGCFGFCAQEPLVNVAVPGKPLLILNRVRASEVPKILDEIARGEELSEHVLCKVEEWDHVTSEVRYGSGRPDVPLWNEIPFFKPQKKIVLRNCGLINPEDIEEYIAVGGYQSLYKVLIDEKPELVIQEIKASRLRGRGGAGYFTGLKWESLRQAPGEEKVLICNADEGDPGAYMNRNEIEGDPHSVLEGMAIGGYVTGASLGIVYVRAEYPLAVHRLRRAVEQAEEHGLLGEDILGRKFDFHVEVVEGAGAFVCGEETALIASLEGKAGRPRPRPPYPAERGLDGKPTNLNNVETWCNVPAIVARGALWFAETGSPKSPGTKVFSLVGKVKNTGLVEMPLGTPLNTFVYEVGGGALDSKHVKAVQTGGPSGGCIPKEMFDAPVDYETLAQLGSIMGSGGMVVMDEDNCMVDVARYFVEFTHSESCGKCVPCRVGLEMALRILDRFTQGAASEADLATLDDLGRMIRDMSLCGLGQTAPNPVLTTVRHFRHEFEDHVRAKRCRAGVCEELALSPCENSCPLHMNIPRFLQLYKEGRIEDAFESVVLDNPLPASTGRVCQHPCENRCRRLSLDKAVNMRDVHRLIADAVYGSDLFEPMAERIASRKLPKNGLKCAVVGAGPTGLTAAFYLALLGYEVTAFDSRAEAGGMLRYALPDYRLPKRMLAREIELIRRLGVQFRFGTPVGTAVSLNDLASGFDAVFISIGTWKESWVYMPGTELRGVYPALVFLEALSKGEEVALGRRVVVVGGGNAAIDSARSAVRAGADVTVVYRRERKDMPAIQEETDAAEAEGVRFIFLGTPHRILGDEEGRVKAVEFRKTRLGAFDSSGRRRPVPLDEVFRVDCDSVILAVGERVDPDFARGSGLKIVEAGTIEVDRFSLETSRENFWAGGDVISGASNVSNAMGYGKRAVRYIDMKLMGENRMPKIFPEFRYSQTAPREPGPASRQVPAELPPGERARTLEEVSLGLTPEQGLLEANRCLRCDVREHHG